MGISEELPLGFGMALMQNSEALERFGALSKAEQQAVISRTHLIKSKKEMERFVDSLAAPNVN